MIHNIFEFDDKEVKDIMTHRKNIVGLDGNMSFIDAIDFMIESGKSRFPVYENDVDNIIGVLHIKDAFRFFKKNEIFRTPIKDIDCLLYTSVFRAPIIVKGIEPNVKTWVKPITIARHAYGDVYKATEMKVPGAGKAELVFTDENRCV